MNRGLAPIEYGTVSSVSSKPVGRRDTLSSRIVTEAVWPAGTRDGLTSLTQRIRYRVRLAASTDSTGRITSNPPILSKVRWPSPSPRMPAATPAAMNALPRVVNPASSDPMRRPSLNLLLSNYDRLWSILITGLLGSSPECPCLWYLAVDASRPGASAAGAVAHGRRSRRELVRGAAA